MGRSERKVKRAEKKDAFLMAFMGRADSRGSYVFGVGVFNFPVFDQL